MPKAYITAPFTEKSVITGKTHVYGEIKDISFKNFLESIDSIAKESGFSTCLVHRDVHQWGQSYIPPEITMQKIMEIMKGSDLVIAYPEYSKGPNVEIGMAVALNKKIIILLNESEKLSLVHAGLNGLSPTKIIRFKDITDMKTKLRQTLSEITEKLTK